jgi:hypothetical protein
MTSLAQSLASKLHIGIALDQMWITCSTTEAI